MKVNLEAIKGIIKDKADAFSERIAPLYELLDWTWRGDNNSPTAAEIEDTIIGLANGLDENKEGHYVSSGGITVGYEIDQENNELEVYVRFEEDDVSILPLKPFLSKDS